MIENIARSSRERGMVNLTETLLTMLDAIIFRCSLGDNFSKEYTDRFLGLMQKANSLIELFSFGDLFPWLKWLDMLRKTAQEIDIFFNQIIDDRIRINSQVDKTDHHGKDE